VVIPNYNGEKFLGPCLDSLRAQTRAPARVLVVDNGSSDRSCELTQKHPLRPELIVLPRNQGFAAAANAGLRAARTEVAVLLNNDAVADPRWIEAGLRVMEREPEVAIVASLMLVFSDRDRVDNAGDFLGRDGRPAGRGRGERAAGYDRTEEVISACAGAAFYRRVLFQEIGFFAEDFVSYLEDLDLGLRARARGRVCLFVPEAVVYHHGAMTELNDTPGKKPVDSSARVFLIAQNRVRLLARAFPAGALARRSPALAFGFMRSFVYHLLISRQVRPFLQGMRAGLQHLAADRSFCRENAATARAVPAALLGNEVRPWRS
jgi:GT2 family glycosyltransferase